MSSLKPFRGNTQGPVEDFLRQVYRWSLSVAADLADLTVDLAADIAAAVAAAAAALAAATAAQTSADAHASRHIRSGADELDGDLVDVDYVPSNYTRTTDGVATNAEHLRAHLVGANAQFGTIATSLALLAPLLLPLRSAYTAASNTLVIGDAFKGVPLDRATAIGLTVPPNSSVAFAVGTLINVYQYNAGASSIVAGSGVTIRSLNSSLTISGRYAMVTLLKIATDEWLLVGTLA